MHDAGGFERFCAEVHPQLVAALAHQVGDRWLAEELAQEALVRAGDRWARVSQLASPLGWTFRVGANLGNSHFRRRRAERRALERHRDASPRHDRDADDQLALGEALKLLTARQRQVVVLRFYVGASVEETAGLVGASPGAVRGMTHRAIVRLREVLDLSDAAQEVSDAS